MRIVFFGTDDIVLPSFNALLDSEHEIVCVVSQPDRPAGRGRKLKSPRIVEIARERSIDVIQKENLKGKLTRRKINSFGQDINVVFAYGCYIPSIIFGTPPRRTINIHPSMLPLHRGANPIRSAILCGDAETGVSIQYVEKVMDTGDVLASRITAIGPDEIFTELCCRLSDIAAELLIDTLKNIDTGRIRPVPQNQGCASECCKWEKDDIIIDWSKPESSIHNQVRAFSLSPGARTTFRGKQLHLLRTSLREVSDIDEQPGPGAIINISKNDFTVAASGGCLAVLEVKPEGKKAMDSRAFINGFRPQAGERLG